MNSRAKGARVEREAVTITLPLPHRCLSPNARCHWAVKAKQTRWYRENACGRTGLATKYARPEWPAATVAIEYNHHVKRNRDRDNALACLKSAFDGLADAGLIKNDSGLTHLPIVFTVDKNRPEGVTLTITRDGAGKE